MFSHWLVGGNDYLRACGVSYPFGGSRVPSPHFQRPSLTRTTLRARSRSADLPLSCINDELLKQFDLSSCVLLGPLECLLSLCGPQLAGLFALVALELIGHPEQCAQDGGAIIAG